MLYYFSIPLTACVVVTIVAVVTLCGALVAFTAEIFVAVASRFDIIAIVVVVALGIASGIARRKPAVARPVATVVTSVTITPAAIAASGVAAVAVDRGWKSQMHMTSEYKTRK
jgi:hypothetical protein